MFGVWLLLVWLTCPVSFGSPIVSGQVPMRFTDYIKKPGQYSFQKKASVLSVYSEALKTYNHRSGAILYYGEDSDRGFYETISSFTNANEKRSVFCALNNAATPCLADKSLAKDDDHQFSLMVDAQTSFDASGLALFLKNFPQLKPGGVYIIELKDDVKYLQSLNYLYRAITEDQRKAYNGSSFFRQYLSATEGYFERLMGFSKIRLRRWVDSVQLTDDVIIIKKRLGQRSRKSNLATKTPENIQYQVCGDPVTDYFGLSLSTRLYDLHQKLFVGDYDQCDELPEQLMHLKYIRSGDKVLELGANIGRGTMVIASLVGDKGHVTASEINPNDRVQLAEFLKINGLAHRVSIVPAIGKYGFIYRGWDSRVWPHAESTILPKGWTFARSIDLPKTQHNVLVADCEGCLLPMMDQYPNLLDGVNKIIIENDASDAVTAELGSRFKSHGFQSKLCVPIKDQGWNQRSENSKTCFYQVWAR